MTAAEVEALLRRIGRLEAELAARDALIRDLRDEIAVLEQKGWLREGCAGAGDFD